MLDYKAYLAEIRSIGGLSGSPVWILFPPLRMNEGTFESDGRGGIYLLGLVRGHWNKGPEVFADFGETEVEQFNTGIAIVTPIQRAVEVINKKEFAEDRRDSLMRRLRRKKGTEDSVTPDGSEEFGRFKELSQRILQAPEGEIDEQPRNES